MPPIPKKPAANARSVRLALGAEVCKTVGPKALGPTVRLATTPDGAKTTGTYEKSINPPTVRLAHVPGAQGDNNLLGRNGVERLPDLSAPALLVSYYYLEAFLKNKHRYQYRDWVMDSGAFSAHNSGVEIKLEDYIEECKRLLACDPSLTEVFALDVIGDWKAGVKNTERMWSKGVEAIPCFHYGEPWSLLKSLCKDYPKVAIGGCVGKRDKDKFAGQCFAHAWPKKLHGFGFGSEKSLMLYPWHSVDATNWEAGPCKYGRWAAFGGASISVRGSNQNLRAEVEWYLELERKARTKWAKEMAQLEALPDAPSVRLATANTNPQAYTEKYVKSMGLAMPTVRHEANGNDGRNEAKEKALQAPPTVRLVGTRGGGGQERIDRGIEKRGGQPPTIRLAVDANSGGYVEGEKRALRTFKKKEQI